MSWVLHAVSLNEIIAIVGLDLEKRIESLLILLVVSSSNEVELTSWSIYALEVVWELMLVFDLHLLAAQVQEVHLEDYTGVLLEQMNHGAWRARIFVGGFSSKHRLSHTNWWVDVHVGRGS